MGFVIQIDNGPTLYHGGDTGLFGGMNLIGERFKPTYALLPVGGHFTLDPTGAAQAARLLGDPTVVPMHYGTFPLLDRLARQGRGRAEEGEEPGEGEGAGAWQGHRAVDLIRPGPARSAGSGRPHRPLPRVRGPVAPGRQLGYFRTAVRCGTWGVFPMDLGKAGWLSSLLEEAVAAHERAPDPVVPPGLPESCSGRARARAYLRRMLRASGLLYGTPAEDGRGRLAQGVASETTGMGAPEELLFRAVVRTLARMALDIAHLAGAPPGPRREQLLLLFAVLTGQLDEAQAIEEKLRQGHEAPRKLWGRVEDALERRAISLAGDPAYGLVLHNGALYADAHMFGRQATATASREAGCAATWPGAASTSRPGRRRCWWRCSRAWPAWTAQPSFSARRAILRQVEDLGLAGRAGGRAARRREAVLRAPPSLARGGEGRAQRGPAALHPGADAAGLAGGWPALAGRAGLHRAPRPGAPGARRAIVHQLELEVAEFYAKNRSVVDVFTVSSAADLMGEDLVSSMQDAMEQQLPPPHAGGPGDGRAVPSCSPRPRAGSRSPPKSASACARSCIDVAKAIPALAIFAAPGGLLLLVALAKVLPFNLLPSSFQDEPAPMNPDEEGSGGDEPPVRKVG